MKKLINGKKNINIKKIITIIVVIIFLLYTSLVLLISNRRYFYIEKVFKSISSSINTFIINKCYSVNNYSANFVSSRIKYLEKENESLRDEVEVNKNQKELILSEVVNHKSKTWYDTIMINNGYRKNIKKDNPVINHLGLVGFISKTGRDISEVKLLTNISNIPVLIEAKEGEIPGIISSYDEDKNVFKIDNITNKTDISYGDMVVLSGYENDKYKGIYVGRVIKNESSNYGLSKSILVKPGVDFNDLLFVSVVVDK